jgi:CDP-glycerol glycerophosphotransferase (TagB/SpsB family)
MTSSLTKLRGRISRVWAGCLTGALYPLSRLFPRSSKRWVFGHQGDVFAGNSKYLLIWLSQNRPDIKTAWITNNADLRERLRAYGFRAYARWSVGGIAAALRSKVYVYCHGFSDINVPISGGALLINLWHGVGIKSTMFGDRGSEVSRHREIVKHLLGKLVFFDYFRKPDVVATTSDFMQQHFSEQFEVATSSCPQIGYPRLDASVDQNVRELACKLDRSMGFTFNAGGMNEIYIYMPTWRDTGRPFFTDALPDLPALNELMLQRNAIFYIKAHASTSSALPAALSNIQAWPGNIDVYPYLSRFDCLITDYSSVLYDYIAVQDSGAVLYTFDYEQYVAEDHTIIYPFDENVVGVRASNFEELCDAIATGAALRQDRGAVALREKFWGSQTPPYSPRVVKLIEQLATGI